MQVVHRVTHEIEVLAVYASCYLQVFHLRVVLVGRNDRVFQVSGGRIYDDIFPCVGVMADKVVLPGRYAFAD